MNDDPTDAQLMMLMAFSECNVSSIDGTSNHLCKLVGHLIITSDFFCGEYFFLAFIGGKYNFYLCERIFCQNKIK
jgi:hypothetical protein